MGFDGDAARLARVRNRNLGQLRPAVVDYIRTLTGGRGSLDYHIVKALLATPLELVELKDVYPVLHKRLTALPIQAIFPPPGANSTFQVVDAYVMQTKDKVRKRVKLLVDPSIKFSLYVLSLSQAVNMT